MKSVSNGIGIAIGIVVGFILMCVACCVCASFSGSSGQEDDSTLENVQIKTIKPEDNSKIIEIGEEFGNNTILAVVTSAELDYADYDNTFIEVGNDEKVISITIKMTNESNESNYVSIGDFSCYVDNMAIDAEMFGGKYNENIEPGRSVELQAIYVIPQDAESIELEYTPIGENAARQIIKIK